jgi:hypothetical protein
MPFCYFFLTFPWGVFQMSDDGTNDVDFVWRKIMEEVEDICGHQDMTFRVDGSRLSVYRNGLLVSTIAHFPGEDGFIQQEVFSRDFPSSRQESLATITIYHHSMVNERVRLAGMIDKALYNPEVDGAAVSEWDFGVERYFLGGREVSVIGIYRHRQDDDFQWSIVKYSEGYVYLSSGYGPFGEEG